MWTTLIVIALILGALGLGVYLFRDKLKALLGKMPPQERKPFPEDPSELPASVLNPVPPPPPPVVVPDIPDPPVVEPPFATSDRDERRAEARRKKERVESSRRFGGPFLTAGAQARYGHLLEVTLKQILDYAPTFDQRGEGRYFIDGSLKGSVASNNIFSPGFILSERAGREAEAIPEFDQNATKGMGRLARKEYNETWIEEKLKPALYEDEFELLASPTAPTVPNQIGRHRAQEAAPPWLAELLDES